MDTASQDERLQKPSYTSCFFIFLPSLVMFFMVMEHWSNVARVSKLSMDHLGLRRFPSGVTQGGYLSGRLSSVSWLGWLWQRALPHWETSLASTQFHPTLQDARHQLPDSVVLTLCPNTLGYLAYSLAWTLDMPLTSEILDTHPFYSPIQQASRCQKFKICISRFQTVFRAQCWLTSLRHAFGLIEKKSEIRIMRISNWMADSDRGRLQETVCNCEPTETHCSIDKKAPPHLNSLFEVAPLNVTRVWKQQFILQRTPEPFVFATGQGWKWRAGDLIGFVPKT